MCDQPVRTKVLTAGGWRGLQEYLSSTAASPRSRPSSSTGSPRPSRPPRSRSAGGRRPDRDRALEPGDQHRPDPRGPGHARGDRRLARPGGRGQPFVAGKVVKGPTETFMAAVGRPSTAAGVASLYEGLIDGMVVDEGDPDPPPAGGPRPALPTLMTGPEARAGLAREVLDFAPGPGAGLSATAILPVKRFEAAKQRLRPGIGDEQAGAADRGDARGRARGDRRRSARGADDRRQR